MKRKEYTNGELTVVWKPEICIHAGKCVELLPKVYNPENSPWIKVENATSEELKAQIRTCPSGALSYYMNNSEHSSVDVKTTRANAMPNGPLIIEGELEVIVANGIVESKSNKTAFCRCGASSNKPYCDGTHDKIDFEG